MFGKKNFLLIVGRHLIIMSVVMLFTLLGISYLSSKIKLLADDVVNSKRLSAAYETRVTQLAKMRSDVERIGTTTETIEKAFIPSDNIEDFITSLERIGKENGITQSFSFENPIATTVVDPIALSSITYHNTIVGSLNNIKTYFKNVENLPYFTKIQGITITSNDSTIGIKGTANVSFDALLYTKTIK